MKIFLATETWHFALMNTWTTPTMGVGPDKPEALVVSRHG